jgi:hypothetical protein
MRQKQCLFQQRCNKGQTKNSYAMTLKRIKHAFKEDEYVRIGDVLEVEALPVFFGF